MTTPQNDIGLASDSEPFGAAEASLHRTTRNAMRQHRDRRFMKQRHPLISVAQRFHVVVVQMEATVVTASSGRTPSSVSDRRDHPDPTIRSEYDINQQGLGVVPRYPPYVPVHTAPDTL